MNATASRSFAISKIDAALAIQDAPVLEISRPGDEPIWIEVSDLRAVGSDKWIEFIAAEAGLEYEDAVEVIKNAFLHFVD